MHIVHVSYVSQSPLCCSIVILTTDTAHTLLYLGTYTHTIAQLCAVFVFAPLCSIRSPAMIYMHIRDPISSRINFITVVAVLAYSYFLLLFVDTYGFVAGIVDIANML